MDPKSQTEKIAELEALIERMKDDLAEARKALEKYGVVTPPKTGNGA